METETKMNADTTPVVAPTPIKISPNTMKLVKLLDEFNEMVDSMKVCMHEMEKRKSKLEKTIEKMVEKEIKEKSKPKKEKKLCGFAVPCLAKVILFVNLWVLKMVLLSLVLIPLAN